jgi:hypothetical protein
LEYDQIHSVPSFPSARLRQWHDYNHLLAHSTQNHPAVDIPGLQPPFFRKSRHLPPFLEFRNDFKTQVIYDGLTQIFHPWLWIYHKTRKIRGEISEWQDI